MKKLWITMVVVPILVISVAFILLGEANDSSLSAISQVTEKTQHNTETSNNFMTQVLEQERHFVEVVFVVVTVFMVVLFGSFAYVNYRVTRSQLIDVEKKMEKKFEEKFDDLRTEIGVASAQGVSIQALVQKQNNPGISLLLHKLALGELIRCPIEYKVVQEEIMNALDRMHEIARDPEVTLTDEIKKQVKDRLDELSEHPFLKEKVEEIKKELK